MNLKKVKPYVKATISLSLIGYLVVLVDWEKVGQLSWWTFGVILAGSCCVLLEIIFMAGRWIVLLQKVQKRRLNFKDAYKGYLIGAFFSIFMPGAIGGDIVRIKYCSDHCKIKLKVSGVIVATERLFGLAALCIYFFNGLIFGGIWLLKDRFSGSDIGFMTAGVVVGAGLLFFLCKQIYITARSSFNALALSLAAQGIDMLVAFAFLNFLYPEARLYWILIVMPLAFLATVLPISLGGLGVREGMIAGVLTLFHVDVSLAILFSFMIYISKVIVGLIGGATFLMNKTSYRDEVLI